MERPSKGIAVDCGCRGNPGKAEYRGVDLETGKVLFEYKIPGLCTNNIAEFAALVEGVKWLILLQKEGKVYSDSQTALSWYKNKAHKSKLEKTGSTQNAFLALAKALRHIPIMNHRKYVEFWSNKLYGEIPADYNRKK
ncbi:MAG: hypothetical protein IT212_07785 [Bacteroidia bacterium]|nr:hypothetical protein [Bacteroidia bacterium]